MYGRKLFSFELLENIFTIEKLNIHNYLSVLTAGDAQKIAFYFEDYMFIKQPIG
jgi:hypothetical protein